MCENWFARLLPSPPPSAPHFFSISVLLLLLIYILLIDTPLLIFSLFCRAIKSACLRECLWGPWCAFLWTGRLLLTSLAKKTTTKKSHSQFSRAKLGEEFINRDDFETNPIIRVSLWYFKPMISLYQLKSLIRLKIIKQHMQQRGERM